ncbi:hypothetical protein D623_10021553 [Myotis brandtii]|uniref:Uncharacterized protein n=1 Tax=Myotis brandtii TaxID=109478 RepID=S7NTZ0_MYOBR|nr:hypothetical protein D623_10021553 [Myotis brandtii]
MTEGEQERSGPEPAGPLTVQPEPCLDAPGKDPRSRQTGTEVDTEPSLPRPEVRPGRQGRPWEHRRRALAYTGLGGGER